MLSVLVVGNAHGEERTYVVKYVYVALHTHGCKLGICNTIAEYVAKPLVIMLIKSGIEIKLTINRLCKKIFRIIRFNEIINSSCSTLLLLL